MKRKFKTGHLICGACLATALGFLAALNVMHVPAPVNAEAHLCPAPQDGMVFIRAGEVLLGADSHYPEEQGGRLVPVAAFYIDRHEVTNREFAAFVAATGYVTVAERAPAAVDYPDVAPEALGAGSVVFEPPQSGDRESAWWRFVPGANWRHPEGPGSSLEGRDDEPVVHVALADAEAYARWKGHALPTEAQWEYAARAGAAESAGGESWRKSGARWFANTWQGDFPERDDGADGFRGRAPVGCFGANAFGLYDMIGNVWEWTLDPWADDHAAAGEAIAAESAAARYVIKGGSYLCSPDYCGRYRPSARQPAEQALGASHIGFRTVKSADNEPLKTAP